MQLQWRRVEGEGGRGEAEGRRECECGLHEETLLSGETLKGW